MTQRKWAILPVLLMVLAALACTLVLPGGTTVQGSGQVVEETRSVDDFSGVELATFGDLIIETGDQDSLRIEAEENLLPHLRTEVRNDVLHLEEEPNIRLVGRQPVRFYLTTDRLDTITISGSGDVQAPDLKAERFTIAITGSGDLETGDLETNALDVAISGSGNVKIGNIEGRSVKVSIAGSGNVNVAGGQVEEQDINITGSGDYEARDLASDLAGVHIPGSGATTLRVAERLDVSISGSGNVRYIGSPDVSQQVSGSGDVERIGE